MPIDPLAGEHHGPVIEHRAEPPSPPPPATIATRDVAQTRAAGDTPLPLPASSGERERARPAEEAESRIRRFPTGAQQAPRKSDEHNGEERKAEEESRRRPFVGGGGRERRRRAAAMADESRVRADMTPMTPVAPAVIPLVHAPDDPGPNADPQPEPEPETDAPPAEGWRRIRALFKS